jgi:hypothetical protein
MNHKEYRIKWVLEGKTQLYVRGEKTTFGTRGVKRYIKRHKKTDTKTYFM